jgi:hypothetical protein
MTPGGHRVHIICHRTGLRSAQTDALDGVIYAHQVPSGRHSRQKISIQYLTSARIVQFSSAGQWVLTAWAQWHTFKEKGSACSLGTIRSLGAVSWAIRKASPVPKISTT